MRYVIEIKISKQTNSQFFFDVRLKNLGSWCNSEKGRTILQMRNDEMEKERQFFLTFSTWILNYRYFCEKIKTGVV